MSRNPQSKDEALEAIDFIVNVLKEHEKDLDKLINELATVTEQLGDNGQINGKVERLEEKIDRLQKEVTSLINYLPKKSPEPFPMATKESVAEVNLSVAAQSRPSLIFRCNQWSDFQALASQAQTLSFSFKEEEKSFQADAVKGNQIITYSGPFPKLSAVLKVWLSRQLNVSESSILEGVLAVS